MKTGTAMASTSNVAGVDVDTRHWIGGRRVASARTFTDVSPIDEQPIAEIARGGEAEVAAAVAAARAAFPGWAAASPADRAACCARSRPASRTGPRNSPRSRPATTGRCSARTGAA